MIAKFFGIKLISELKKERRFKVFRLFGGGSRAALVGFGPLAPPFQCGGHVFERLVARLHVGRDIQLYRGRKVTDMLASLLGVSMVFSSGVAKSFGLFAMNEMHVGQF